jgi:AcrR family transcriptional regulator
MNMSAATPPAKRRYSMAARAQAAAATRERVLATAWEHFSCHPYDEVPLRQIAAAAHVSPQTLHNLFQSKEELFTAAFLWWGAGEISERNAAPVGQVREAIHVLFDRYENHGPAILRLLSQETRIPAVRQMTDAGRAYHRHWVHTTFASLARGLKGERRERRLAALVAATDLLIWKLLRHDMKLDRPAAELVMAELVGDDKRTPRGTLADGDRLT